MDNTTNNTPENLTPETLADFRKPLSGDIPVLTLEPTVSQAVTAAPDVFVQAAEPAHEVNTTDNMEFSPEEQKIIREFAAQIDVTNTNQVLHYGSEAQEKISTFSEAALDSVRTKDLGEVGEMIGNLVVELKNFDADEESKGFFGFFKKAGNKLDNLKVKYDKAESNVERIADVLEDHKFTLTKDITLLDNLYALNLQNFRQLSMYIAAGKMRLQEIRSTQLPALVEKAKLSQKTEDSQAANDLAEFCNRFEKKLYDLELTRTISMQMAPQIRLIQNNDTMMVEKIQTTIVNTIPLWKSQMVLALGLAHSEEAMRAQREVSDMTNELLKKNAEKLKLSTVETARESERGIVDIETLKATNQSLIETLDSVRKIQEEGSQKRHAAEAELTRIENDLKNKLLEFRG